MPEFLTLLPPKESLDKLLRNLPDPKLATETISTDSALGRITATDLRAPHALPEFPRSTVDGFAVKAADTYGASNFLPAYLNLIGECPMGAAPELEITPTTTAIIHTGGMLPKGADAVVMLEYTQTVDNEIEILRAVADGENVIRIGEDVVEGSLIKPKGSSIRPAEVGGMMALGFTQIEVAKHPKIGIISSGDEVVTPEKRPEPGQVRDINSYTLSTLVEKYGGEPVIYGIVADSLDAMKMAISRALDECEMVLITAGSSASARDMTAAAIGELGEPGVLVHGVNTRPGKPTILGVCDGKAVIGLPGNPVSALVNGYVFVAPLVRRLLGQSAEELRPSISAKLTVNIPSQAGREDWIPVKLVPERSRAQSKGGFLANPIFGKSNLIFTLVSADGLLKISADATGLSTGEIVEVILI
ncbi:MAG: molybdopterin molybdenumtransferase MoeA [Anaerolineae bacterium]|jgi:molybdopterin molybdotransferase|nr:molybdopterin molybdenumtransferase MoeA [Anaerolineae bacterium]MBT4458250.1 molybdopterin molybdenumtransferase MoeA [Anaerolineae bacterium]MBT4840995.1 molybdopterin molybdenumtransferase MoeA [Anaerolineae bacterium]MBT6061131.1 molybdopterin molybdenumtransferase MoeA [Anaerolineae bacterium]MBT6322258.1 molybdopterin molybdenumtransferase MoeA [Anaerolineae bacterium]